MAFVPLTDEEKRILSGEEPEEKSPDTGTGGLFGGINISSIPEVAEARERIEREPAREPFDIPENPFAVDPSPSSPRMSAYKMLEDLPEPAESFQGEERLNMETPGSGTIVELSPGRRLLRRIARGTARRPSSSESASGRLIPLAIRRLTPRISSGHRPREFRLISSMTRRYDKKRTYSGTGR